jgi:hypothetical protein
LTEECFTQHMDHWVEIDLASLIYALKFNLFVFCLTQGEHWVEVDLGKPALVSSVLIDWEAAYRCLFCLCTRSLLPLY